MLYGPHGSGYDTNKSSKNVHRIHFLSFKTKFKECSDVSTAMIVFTSLSLFMSIFVS